MTTNSDIGTPVTRELQKKAIEAAERSAAAVRSSADMTVAVSIAGTIGTPLDAWKECRATIDRFDKLLVDLRKTGFGFVTAVAAAMQFLINDQTNFSTKIALLAMLVLLIVTLYLIDLTHQVWLEVTVRKAMEMEEILFGGSNGLSSNIHRAFKDSFAIFLGLFLYNVLLLTACAVFWCTVPKGEPLTSGHHGSIVFAWLIGFGFIIGSFVFSTRKKYYLQMRWTFVVFVIIVFPLIAMRHFFGYSPHFF